MGFFNNHYHNLGEFIIIEIWTKLGNIKSRSKNIYYTRFIMLIANHIAPTMALETSWKPVGLLGSEQEIVQGPSKDQFA